MADIVMTKRLSLPSYAVIPAKAGTQRLGSLLVFPAKTEIHTGDSWALVVFEAFHPLRGRVTFL